MRTAAALACLLLSGTAAAQGAAACDDIGMVGSRMISRDTQAAGAAARDLVRKAGVDADLRAIRQRVLQDDYRKADVDVTLRKMLQAYCEVVWADAGLSDGDKAARVERTTQELLKPVQGPAEVARTNSRIRDSGRRAEGLPLAWRGGLTLVRWRTVGFDLAQATAADDEFLRDAPAFVNDSNKYFVVVGSAASEAQAIALMNRLKARAPKHDFVVYLPYGGNRYYAVMMATWVSKEVAEKALRAARDAGVADAYLWTCRSTGESC